MESEMTNATQIDLMPFCEPDDGNGRYALQTPWREDGFIYATDGRRIARVPDDGRAIDGAEGKRPDSKKLFAECPAPLDGWKPLPDLADCPCTVGEVEVTCEFCDGDGTRECDLGHIHKCDECKSGKVTEFQDCKCTLALGGEKFMRLVVKPFWSVQCEYAVGVALGQPAMFFRAEGFDGIAMGLSNA